MVQHAERVNRKINVSTVLWKSPIITHHHPVPGGKHATDYIGMALVEFERLITQKMTLNIPLVPLSSTPIQSEEPANHPLHFYLHKIILSSIVTDITNGSCSTRKNVSMELSLGNGQIRERSVTGVGIIN